MERPRRVQRSEENFLKNVDFILWGKQCNHPKHIFRHFQKYTALFVSKAKINIFWKAKINVFWNFFFTPLAPSGPLHSEKFQKTLILAFQKTLILAFEANSALSRENETKIVKITHSVLLNLAAADAHCSGICIKSPRGLDRAFLVGVSRPPSWSPPPWIRVSLQTIEAIYCCSC